MFEQESTNPRATENDEGKELRAAVYARTSSKSQEFGYSLALKWGGVWIVASRSVGKLVLYIVTGLKAERIRIDPCSNGC